LIPTRICIVCKRAKKRDELVRLTVPNLSNQVYFVASERENRKIFGRSAYFCRSQKCLNAAVKGPRLKYALEGRKPKGNVQKRSISWPLESQLIKLIEAVCAEA
jgi:predicted RNA-binding protein YlxR (DUF448 family)